MGTTKYANDGGGKAKPFPAPASPSAAVGWRLRFFWPAGRKEFAGLVLGYDPDSGQHTVQWENGPGGRTGVTATNLDDGLVTWVEAPGAWGTATGGGGIPPRKSGTTIAETEKLASSSQKKKKQKLADAGAEAKKQKQKKPPSVPRPKSDETLQEVEKRIGVGTIKGICFQVLRDAGPTGLLLSEIVKRTQQRGLKDWESVNQPSNTVNACCSGDPAFVKVAPGRVGLACLGAMESPDLAAQEEREHGEKVLYCDACRGGPFNTKGMRMHISRWCAFAKGNARGEEGVVPRAVTDKVAAAADLAKSRALAMDRMVAKTNQGDDGDDGSKKSLKKWTEPSRELRTIRCDQCSAGPFNKKGFAMHVSRWCKYRANASGGGSGGQFGAQAFGGGYGGADVGRAFGATAPTLSGGGFGSPFRLGTPWFGGASSGGLGGTLGFGGLDRGIDGLQTLTGINPAKGRKRGVDEADQIFAPPSPPSMLPGNASFSTGLDLAAMFGNLTGVPHSGGHGGVGGQGHTGGGGFARGLIDYMAKSFSGGGALSGGLSGGVLGGGLRRNFEKATAEQAAPVELKIDVKVYKEDGNFVARAPLAVPSTVTLGGLKLAVSANTNGALPPNRQRLTYNGEYLPLDDHRLLREFVVAAKKKDEKIEMDLTIMHEA